MESPIVVIGIFLFVAIGTSLVCHILIKAYLVASVMAGFLSSLIYQVVAYFYAGYPPVDRWARAKMQYPYFTTFVINMLYIAHHAMTRPNDKIDLNAQADLNLMTHLLHADAIVSNETGFLRQGFEDIWRPRGKVIFTSQQFADFSQKL